MQDQGTQQADRQPDSSGIQLDMSTTSLKIDLPAIVLKPIDISKFNFMADAALINYHKQSEAEKQLSPYRFWKKPDSLKERCVQFIAAQELEAGEKCKRGELPRHLNKEIDQSLEQASSEMGLKKMMEDNNKRNYELKALFDAEEKERDPLRGTKIKFLKDIDFDFNRKFR